MSLTVPAFLAACAGHTDVFAAKGIKNMGDVLKRTCGIVAGFCGV